MIDINTLGQNQAQIQRQLKPTAGENKIGQAAGAVMGQVVLHVVKVQVEIKGAIVWHMGGTRGSAMRKPADRFITDGLF